MNNNHNSNGHGNAMSIKGVGSVLKKNMLAPAALIMLIIIFAVATPYFLTFGNAMNIVRQASVNIIIALGVTIVIITGGIDLSVGAILGLVMCVMGHMWKDAGVNIWGAAILGILVGVGIGVANGLIIHFGKITPFIVTLGMMNIARGFTFIISKGSPVSGFPAELLKIGEMTFISIPFSFLLSIILLVLGCVVLKYTELGRNFYAVGGNEEAARLSGISIAKTKLWAYGISGLGAAIAAVVLTARINTAPPDAGAGYELDAIAAAVIGGASLDGGKGSLIMTLLGAIIIATLGNGLSLLNVNSYVQIAITGAVIIVTVFINNIRERGEE